MSDTPAPPAVHPMCVEMHRHGYCICTMVQCLWCERCHAAHKPCAERREREEPVRNQPAQRSGT